MLCMYVCMYIYMVLNCIKNDQTCAAVQEDIAKVLEKETDNMKPTEAAQIELQLAICL